eukprot:TRINITY_DN1456_c0_g1_i2.p1 TRINITY_DN1456_c0_g1~~TRINITY_DN1456_c0_g1_i2.p1  ORF type:complete len:384 (+),score=61.24 TRINITY_DN1456_c0_g1_i2:228-1379(+)
MAEEFGAALRFSCLLWALIFVALDRGGILVAGQLPPDVCYWTQGLIQPNDTLGHPSSNCTFQVRHPDFLAILGASPVLQFEAAAAAHEGGVYYPDTNEFFFTTKRVENQTVKLQKLDLGTKVVSTVVEDTDFGNGLVLDHQGQLLVCEQGKIDVPGHIQRVDPRTGNSTRIADNWFNIPFNSPNDVVVKTDGSIWITDPDYGSVQGFRAAPKVDNQVYRIDPLTGVVDVVGDMFTKPNGLAFSADESTLYVTDTGYALGTGAVDVERPHSITAFDVKKGRFLRNRSLFTAVARYDGTGLGVPDGIKVDTRGNVYVATGDGIQVFNEDAQPLGLIRVDGAANMGFAGPLLDTLYILNDVSIQSVKLSATGAGLVYAAKYHQIPL